MRTDLDDDDLMFLTDGYRVFQEFVETRKPVDVSNCSGVEMFIDVLPMDSIKLSGLDPNKFIDTVLDDSGCGDVPLKLTNQVFDTANLVIKDIEELLRVNNGLKEDGTPIFI